MTRMEKIARSLVLAILVALGPATAAQADPIQATYNTTGTIGTTGISGTPDVSFQGVSDGTLTTGQPFSLGQFIVAPSDGGTAIYGATPFQITVSLTSASGDPSLPKETPITLDGMLDTNLNASQRILQAYFVSTAPPTVGASILKAYTHWITEGGSVVYGLYPTSTLIDLSPTSQNGGIFGVQTRLDAYSAPEPSTFATFVAAAMSLTLKYRFSRRRRIDRT